MNTGLPHLAVIATYDIVILLLAENKTELRVLVIWFLELRSEDNHYPVLEEVIVLAGVGVEALVLKIVDPTVDGHPQDLRVTIASE